MISAGHGLNRPMKSPAQAKGQQSKIPQHALNAKQCIHIEIRLQNACFVDGLTKTSNMKKIDDKKLNLADVLGDMVKADELARFLDIDARTVKKFHKRFGGIEILPGKFYFKVSAIKEMLS